MREPDDQLHGFIAGIILGLIITLLILLLTTPAWSQVRRPAREDNSLSCQLWGICKPIRLRPEDNSLYKVPRSVGAWSGAGDMQQSPERWYPLTNTEPTWQTFNRMASYDITAVGKFMRAHPTDVLEAYNECGELLPDASTNNENIRRAFRTDGIDIVVIRPEHWGSTEVGCNGKNAVRWENYPSTLFQDMYKVYAGQEKAVYIMSLEADLQLYGVGCGPSGGCVPYMDYSCEDVLEMRRKYLVRIFDERQAAAMAARSMYPNAALRVFHAVEVNYYHTRDWETMTVLADVIPDMIEPPDFIGLSIWPAAGDPLEALYYAMEMTGLPAYRFFISQVGAREGSQPDGGFFYSPHQRDRLMYVIPTLFDAGVAFAIVWSMEQPEPTGWTGHSIIDHVTGERLSGWETIIELNNLYR